MQNPVLWNADARHVTGWNREPKHHISAPKSRGEEKFQSKDARIRIQIISAKGLGKADVLGKSDPFVICEVPGIAQICKTEVKKNTQQPVWNFEHISKYTPGHALKFAVWDKDNVQSDLLGEAELASEHFYPDGFHGELALKDAKKPTKASLAIRVDMLEVGEDGHASKERIFDIVADANVMQLGIAPERPPGKVHVLGCHGWGEKNMVKTGDEIVALNGEIVEAMDETTFTILMKQRPLTLRIRSVTPMPNVSDDGLTQSVVPPRSVRMRIQIFSAQGLSKADALGNSDPFVICEIAGKGQICRTPVKDNTQDPVWDFDHTAQYTVGESLKFTVWDKDTINSDLLGESELSSQRFYPAGFHGEMYLNDAKKNITKATLAIRIDFPELAENLQGERASVCPGTILHCIIEGDHPASVFRSVQSPAVIGAVQRGDNVVAAGAPVQSGDAVLVAIRPTGIVELIHFVASERGWPALVPPQMPQIAATAMHIREGSPLMCLPPPSQGLADVFESCHSHSVIDVVHRGSFVVAAGQPKEKWGGCVMVPIRPRGAVDFSFFQLKLNAGLAGQRGANTPPSSPPPISPARHNFPRNLPRSRASFDAAVTNSKIVLTLAVFAGLDARAICALSASIRDAVVAVWQAAKVSIPDCLYVCGGSGNGLQMLDSMEYFSLATGRFERAPSMMWKRVAPAGTILGAKFYVCGGCTDESPAVRSVECFDLVSASWGAGPPMHVARVGAAAAVLGGELYVCGGRDGSLRVMNSVERLTPGASNWSTCTPMLEHRLYPCVGVLGRRLYMCGGSDHTGRTLRSAEHFTAGDRSWQIAPPMGEHRRGAAAAFVVTGVTGLFTGCLYVCGGWCGTDALSSTERFVARTDVWEQMPQMSSPRSHAAAVISGQHIYVFGGFSDGECLNTVDRFDIAVGRWNARGMEPLLERRAYCAVAFPSG